MRVPHRCELQNWRVQAGLPSPRLVVHEASVADEGHSLAQYMVALSTTEGLCPVGGDGGEGGGTEGGAGSNSVLDFKIRIDGHKM